MKKILVTGASGFIGKNLCVRLEQESEFTVIKYDRTCTLKELARQLSTVDFIYHLAGTNRPEEEKEFDNGNRVFTEELLKLIESSKKQPTLLFSSSIQANLDSPYGKSKRAAEEVIRDWSKRTKNKAYIYRLPNVFGKWSRPEYNSVVATFCHHISRDIEITVNDPSSEMTLVYIDDVVDVFIECLNGRVRPSKDGFYSIDKQFKITVGGLAQKIKDFNCSRTNLTTPNLADDLDRYLYATYVSFLDEDSFGYALEMKTDERGWLSEFIKSKGFGQIFISYTKPGVTRGNHWHQTKVEKFLVVEGEAEISFRGIASQRVLKYPVDSNKIQVIDIPPGYIHSIKNTGKTDLITIFWADELFDPKHPDTYYEEVYEKT